jgi:hypothetical protein
LALVFYDDGDALASLNVDPDEVYDALLRRGVRVPPLRPPIAPTPIGPSGPRVYFGGDDFSAVIDAFCERYPPRTSQWGWNLSMWRPGLYWIDAEDDIDSEAIVREVATDHGLVEVVPIDVAMTAENEAIAAEDT